MGTVHSSDGTAIAFDRTGSGPALILVDGAFGSRTFGPNGPLAKLLAADFTVYTYDRRGRGASGDNPAYTVDREVDDIAALLKEAGGSANLYGISSGAALALEAANHGLDVTKLALYEAPFVVDDTRAPIPADYLDRVRTALATNRRGDAVRLFMTEAVGVPGVFVTMMRFMPAWPKLKSVAHTVVYDATVLGDTGSGRPLPTDRWTGATAPTLVISGGKSPQWMRNGMQALASALPNASHYNLEGQTHIVKPKVLAPVLANFFAS